ncbi:zinc finger protein 813 isoform X2 [Bicyclus anynana]|uniref:Zinc finger protein 813 isoform X2 n=1 Tax=Bicyclus anynana TaxID=110368 RepID=A0ABM3M4H6_BICAN|nr:zinc finger protein 813 isoform X2 [Bicyclus anynana]
MEMYTWDCCRTCLGTRNLHPIFVNTAKSDKYTKTIFTVTGVKVELNDTMPQDICVECINFINKSIKFRRKCEEVQNMLQENGTKCKNVKLEYFKNVKEECHPSIDITDSYDDDFKDFDDNITLDALQYQNIGQNNLNNDEIVYGSITNNVSETSDDSDDKIIKTVNHSADSNGTMIKTVHYSDDSNDKIVDNQYNGDQLNVVEFHKTENDSNNDKIVFNTVQNHDRNDEINEDIENKSDNKVHLIEKQNLFSKKRKTRVRAVRKKEKSDEDLKTKQEIECEFCHKILTSKLSLRNHYKIHTGFDIVCEIHERLHTGEKPFVCKSCGAGFHRKSSYLQHVAIHLPEKTVQCDQCPARFKSVTLMRIHKNRHRPSPYTFKCGVCNNSFARRRNVARHLQRVHGLAPDHHIHRIKIH